MIRRRLNHNSQAGFSLIEVMVAVLVLASGSAGLGLLLLTSLQGTLQAQERSQVALQAAELAQLIYANPAVWGHAIHANAQLPGCQDADSCEPGEWASQQLEQWQQALQDSVAQAEGLICNDSSPLDGELADPACDGQGDSLIKVVWQEAARPQQIPRHQRLVLPLPQ